MAAAVTAAKAEAPAKAANMMTRRENFLATLRHQPHERLPAAFVIDNMNYPYGCSNAIFDPARCFEVGHSVKFQRRLGLDVLIRISPTGISETAASQYWREDSAGGSICETPIGNLHAGARAGPGQPMLHNGAELLLKQPEDFDTLAWLIERSRYEIVESELQQAQSDLHEIGPDGVLYVNPPSTAVMDAVRTWCGISAFVFALMDHPDKVERLLQVATDRACEQWELISRWHPASILTLWDDATTSLISRDIFATHCVPALKRYADICHQHGKTLVNHTCGKFRGIADLYAIAEQDAIDWLAVPPTGDMTLRLAEEMWRGKVVPMVAPDPSIVRNGTPEAVRDHLIGILDPADRSNVIVLLPCPQGTPLTNARTLALTLAERYGARLDGDLLLG